MKRRDEDCVGRKVLEMQLPGKRKRGRPKRRYLDVMEDVGAWEDKVFDRSVWRINCGGHYGKSRNKKICISRG